MPNLAIQIRERHLNALSVSGNNLEKERDGGGRGGVGFEKLCVCVKKYTLLP